MTKVNESKIKKTKTIYTTEELFSYLDKIYENNNKFKCQKIRKEIRKDIKNKIVGALKITGLNEEELLSRLDFKPKDITVEALESFLAELRAIFWLRNLNFTNIDPIKAKNKEPSPDFIACNNNQKFAIEVFCLTQVHEQKRDSNLNVFVNIDPEFYGSKFGKDIMSKAKYKKTQLDSFRDVKKKLLLCVVNSGPMVSLNDQKDWVKHAKFIYEKLNWGNNYYIGILTGAIINGEVCDVIYPALDQTI